jgi:predicted DNA-binding WGR domain protein
MNPTFDKFSELLNYLHYIGGFESEWSHRWECAEGTANKYWEVYHPEGMGRDDIEVRWGRIGSKPQSVVKGFNETVRKAEQKVQKGGYKDVGGWFNAGTPEEAGLKPASEADLPEPFNRIARFAGRSGDEVWIAMDEHGAELLRMPKAAAAKFAETHLDAWEHVS